MEISRHSVPDSMSVSKGKRDLAKGVHHFSFLEEMMYTFYMIK